MALVQAPKDTVSYIRELKPRKDTLWIEVRIILLWRNYDKESGNTIEMVFVDKEVSEDITAFSYISDSSFILFLLYNKLKFFLGKILFQIYLFCFHRTLIIYFF